MRKISLIAVAALLLVSGNVFARDIDPCVEDLSFLSTEPSKITEQIEDLLEENRGFNLGDQDEIVAEIRFMLNSEKEIVVLSVDTDDDRLESFLKARLNYEKVLDQNAKEGKVYAMPIRIRA